MSGARTYVEVDVAAPMPWLRAIAFGLVGSSIGTFGHALAGGTGVRWGILLVAFLVLTCLARLLAEERFGRLGMLFAVTMSQLLVHVACLLASPTHAHAVHGAPPPELAATSHGLSHSLLMLLMHAAAILVAAVVLLRLEVKAWACVATIAARVSVVIRRFVGDRQRRIATVAAPLAALCVERSLAPVPRWAAACVGRRGPPCVGACS